MAMRFTKKTKPARKVLDHREGDGSYKGTKNDATDEAEDRADLEASRAAMKESGDRSSWPDVKERLVEAGDTALLEDHRSPDELPTLHLPTAHHFQIVRVAVEERSTSLKKLADKTADEGYIREARVISGDAQALKEDVLPQLEVQPELFGATMQELQAGIANELRGLVHKHVLADHGDETDIDHRGEMCEQLALRVATFALDVAERAYNAGLRARSEIPEVFAVRSLEKLRAS